jgi:hypothetical protein
MNIIQKPTQKSMLRDLSLLYKDDIIYSFTEKEISRLWIDNFCTDDDIVMPDEVDSLVNLINEFHIEL